MLLSVVCPLLTPPSSLPLNFLRAVRISKASNDLSLNLAGFRGGEIRAVGQVACKAKEERKVPSSFWQKPFGLNFSGLLFFFFKKICYFLKQNMNMSYLKKNYQATFIEMLVKVGRFYILRFFFPSRHEGGLGLRRPLRSRTEHGGAYPGFGVDRWWGRKLDMRYENPRKTNMAIENPPFW